MRIKNSYNKYGNKKTVVDGIKFDSKKEADYYVELKIRKRAGDILDFKLQPNFILQDAFVLGGRRIRAIQYRADFTIYHDGFTEIVDVKGMQTAMFKLKWKLLLFKHGRDPGYKFTII